MYDALVPFGTAYRVGVERKLGLSSRVYPPQRGSLQKEEGNFPYSTMTTFRSAREGDRWPSGTA